MFAAKRGGDETRFVKARICCGWINVEGFAGERAHSVCGMARISVSCGERLIGRTWSRRHAGKTPTLAGRSSFPRSPARRGKFPDGQNAPKPCFFATRQNTARYSAAPLPAGQTASNAHTGSAPCPAGQGSVASPVRVSGGGYTEAVRRAGAGIARRAQISGIHAGTDAAPRAYKQRTYRPVRRAGANAAPHAYKRRTCCGRVSHSAYKRAMDADTGARACPPQPRAASALKNALPPAPRHSFPQLRPATRAVIASSSHAKGGLSFLPHSATRAAALTAAKSAPRLRQSGRSRPASPARRRPMSREKGAPLNRRSLLLSDRPPPTATRARWSCSPAALPWRSGGRWPCRC